MPINYRHLLATRPAIMDKATLISALDCSNPLPPEIEGLESDVDRFAFHENLEAGAPPIVLVIPSHNNAAWVKRNLASAFGQSYPHYRILYIDDGSTDATVRLLEECLERAPEKRHIFRLLRAPERNGPAASRFVAYHYCDPDEVLCMLDGDDWLADAHALERVAAAYRAGAMCTYGSYQRYEGGKVRPFVYGPGEVFPPEVLRHRCFRQYRWISQHLRTGYAGLFQRIRYTDLVDAENRFYPMCTDLAETFPLLEMAAPHIQLIPETTLIYNVDASQQNSTSYFRQASEPQAAQRRKRILERIHSRRPYPSVSKRELFMGRYHRPSWVRAANLATADYVVVASKVNDQQAENWVRILEACGLPAIVPTHNLDKARCVWSREIRIGQLREDLSPADCVVVKAGVYSSFLQNKGCLLAAGSLVIGQKE